MKEMDHLDAFRSYLMYFSYCHLRYLLKGIDLIYIIGDDD
jgi:hypothetical protein